MRAISQRETDVGTPGKTGALVGLRRRWFLVVLAVLLGLVSAAVLTRAQDVRYTATTSVLVLATDIDASLSTSRPEVNMDTEAELVRSAQVAEVTRALLRTPAPPGSLRAGLEVTVPLNSQVLTITYSDRTAAAAQAGAQAFAQGYLTYRGDQAERDLGARSGALQADLTAAQQELRLATDKAAALPANSPDRVFAEAQQGILSNRISSLSARLSALLASSPTPGQIITAAPLPESPTSPTTTLNYAGGLVAGLLLGVALAGLVDRFDRRIWGADHVVRWVGQPVLLDLPKKAAGLESGSAAHAGGFDRLRNALVARGELPEVLQIMDPGGRGASAAVTAGMVQSVVRVATGATLVLAHDQSPLTPWLGLQGRAGLSDLLLGTAELEDVVVPSEKLPGVRVLPAGRTPEALATLLQSREARVVLQQLRSSGTTTVIETRGAGQSAAAQTVASVSDAVLLVAERGVTDHRLVTASVAATREMGVEVAGVVLTPPVRLRLVRQLSEAASGTTASEAGDQDPRLPTDADADAPPPGRRPSGNRNATVEAPARDVFPAAPPR